MVQVTVAEAKTQLSSLLDAVEACQMSIRLMGVVKLVDR